jgi:capsular exopolysaccharide synthesis family protein
MELTDYLDIIGRRKWVVILTLLFTFAVVTIGVLMTPLKYTAESKIRVLTTKTGGSSYVDYNIAYAERLLATYTNIATSAPILDELSRSTSISKDDINDMLKVEAISGTELIKISVQSVDPVLAQFMANKLAQILVNQSKSLYSDDVNPVNIYIIEQAPVPDIPSSPNPLFLISLGAIAGLIGGVVLAILFESLDMRIYTSKQMEGVTHMKIVGDIPVGRDDIDEGLIISNSRLHSEAFHRLQTNIFSPMKEENIRKTLLVTSAVTQDGKSFIAANLGLSIAKSQNKVLIVDANLRWPMLHKIFHLDNQVGFSDLLKLDLNSLSKQDHGVIEYIEQTIVPIVDASTSNLYVIPSGPVPTNPVELLDSRVLNMVIERLKEQFDFIIFDSPPCLSVTDPVVLASKISSVLVVVRSGWVRRDVLTNSLRQLKDVNANLIGVVANRTKMGVGSRFAK